MTSLVLAALLTAALAAAPEASPQEPVNPPPAAAQVPAAPPGARAPEYPPVVLGVGLGPSFDTNGDGSTGTALRFRFGVARSPRLLAGLEGSFARGGDDRRAALHVGATWLPWERFALVRAGLGVAAHGAPGGATVLGPSLLVGVGCAFGDRRGLDLSINLEAQQQLEWQAGGSSGLGERGDTRLALWLGLDWY